MKKGNRTKKVNGSEQFTIVNPYTIFFPSHENLLHSTVEVTAFC